MSNLVVSQAKNIKCDRQVQKIMMALATSVKWDVFIAQNIPQEK
jgi:hypothetical protein